MWALTESPQRFRATTTATYAWHGPVHRAHSERVLNMGGKKKARKKLYVSRRIQGGMLAKLALYWGVYHFVLWHAMFMYRYMQYRADVLGGAAHVSFAELYSTFAAQHYSMVLCAVGVFPIVLWDMVKITHRIAGPLVRFQNTLREMAKGVRPRPIKLRRGDLLVELQDAFNEYVTSLEAKASKNESEGAATSHGPSDERQVVADLEAIQSDLNRDVCDGVGEPTLATSGEAS